jgi:hypothetical protein
MTTIDRFRYEVDENLTLRIWDNTNTHGEPFILQPDWPDGTPWGSIEAASSWAETKIGEFLDENSVLAGVSPSQPTMARLTKLEETQLKLESMGLSVDELKTILGLE